MVFTIDFDQDIAYAQNPLFPNQRVDLTAEELGDLVAVCRAEDRSASELAREILLNRHKEKFS